MAGRLGEKNKELVKKSEWQIEQPVRCLSRRLRRASVGCGYFPNCNRRSSGRDVDYIAKAYCRSLSKVQRVSVEASLSVVAHSYEGEDAVNLLKGRSHIGGPSCRRQESERQFKKSTFLECSRSAIIPHWFLSVPATTGPSAIVLHLLVVRGRDFGHFGHRRIPTDLLVRRQSYFDKCNSSSRYWNDVFEFREIFRGRLDQGLVSFQHRLCPSGAVFFQRYWKSLPVLFYGAHAYVKKLVQPQATQ